MTTVVTWTARVSAQKTKSENGESRSLPSPSPPLPPKWTYLDEAGRVGSDEVGNGEALGRRDAEVVETGADELVGGDLGALHVAGLHLVLFERQRRRRLQGVVDGQQRQAGPQQLPQALDGVAAGDIALEMLQLLQVALEAGDLGETLLEGDTDLVERPRGVGLLVDDVAGGDDLAADRRAREGALAGQRGQGGRGHEGGGAGHLAGARRARDAHGVAGGGAAAADRGLRGREERRSACS